MGDQDKPLWETGQPGVPALPGQEGTCDPHPSWSDAEKWAWKQIRAGRALFALIIALLCFAATPAQAASGTKPNPKWNEAEKWVWSQIVKGLPADFNKKYGVIDPSKEVPKHLQPGKRSLSKAFLESILSDPKLAVLNPRKPLVIKGAIFKNGLQIKFIQITRPIDINKCRILGDFSIRNIKSNHNMRLIQTFSTGMLSIHKADIEATLSIIKCKFINIFIGWSNFRTQLVCDNNTVDRGFILYDTVISGDLIARNIYAKLVEMKKANIGRSVVARKQRASKFVLIGCSIGAELDIEESVYRESVLVKNANIGSDIDARNTKGKLITMIDVVVNDKFFIRGADYKEFYLENVRINAFVDGYFQGQDNKNEGWPDRIFMNMVDFKYLWGEKDETNIWWGARSRLWYLSWLAKIEGEIFPVYITMSKIIGMNAPVGGGDFIMYSYKERVRGRAWQNKSYYKWLWLTIVKNTIGYGVGVYKLQAFIPFILIVFIGTGVAGLSRESWRKDILWNAGYSLDKALPFIRFNKEFWDITPSGWPRNYFVFIHVPLGYVFAFYGLAGVLAWVG